MSAHSVLVVVFVVALSVRPSVRLSHSISSHVPLVIRLGARSRIAADSTSGRQIT